MQNADVVEWQLVNVTSPSVPDPVAVVAAKNIRYIANGNLFQTLNIYLRKTTVSTSMLGTVAMALPSSPTAPTAPRQHVHIHGGAWRDPFLTATSIEPTVACAFSSDNTEFPIDTIISLNYTVSPFPTHPTSPYDPEGGDKGHPEREARHPDHLRDILSAFDVLRKMGLSDDSYILSGHSCGACLAFQSTLRTPNSWGLKTHQPPPRPAALLGMNGLYDFPMLVHGLGLSHSHLRDEYQNLLSISFGDDQTNWPFVSPARFDVDEMARVVVDGTAPKLVLVDQSTEDQLVPMNELERMRTQLDLVSSLRVIRLHRCVGTHAEPWERGSIIWQCIQDILGSMTEAM